MAIFLKLTHHYTQAQVLGEGIKVAVAVQHVVPAFHASGGYHSIDGLSNGHAEYAQRTKIFRRLNRDFLTAELNPQRGRQFPGSVEVRLVAEAL